MRKSSLVTAAAVLGLLGVSLLSSGCASHFGNLPAKQEFSKSIPSLEQQYHELSDYNPTFGRFMLTPVWNMPYADDLITKWGRPDEESLSWWNLGTLFIPHNMHRWYWYIEDKRVDVLIDKPLIYGYEPHVFTMKVDNNGRPKAK